MHAACISLAPGKAASTCGVLAALHAWCTVSNSCVGLLAVCVCVCSIWGVIFTLQGAAAVYAALETGYQMPGKCAAVNAVGEFWRS